MRSLRSTERDFSDDGTVAHGEGAIAGRAKGAGQEEAGAVL